MTIKILIYHFIQVLEGRM